MGLMVGGWWFGDEGIPREEDDNCGVDKPEPKTWALGPCGFILII